MGTLYVDTGGNPANSGSTDSASATLTGTSATFVSGTTVQLDSGTDLSSVETSGASQSTINIAGATNTNRTIFWITAVSGSGGATPQVTLDVAPTGMTTNSWRIGGQYVFPSSNTANVIVNALRAGDTLQFNNTPSGKTSTYITSNVAGDNTSGRIRVIGRSGVRPVLANTGAGVSPISVSHAGWHFENLEITSTANGAIMQLSAGAHVYNLKISGSSGGSIQHGIVMAGNGSVIKGCEIGPVIGSGINPQSSVTMGLIVGNYIHDCTVDGITEGGTGPGVAIVGNVIEGNTGRGIYFSGSTTAQSHALLVYGNTIYGNGNSGFEVADADSVVLLVNNIIQSTLTGVATAKWAAGSGQLVSMHSNNVFYNSADANSGVSGFTLNSTESSSDPLLVNPGSNNFAISSSSPAAEAGMLGALPVSSASTGYQDIGAVQRQAVAARAYVIGS
ncbi:right-handed parallel beta-helix repeat-containing protein [Bradyrhizobium icense]|uniref:Right handed beta helix domain-containing protein n=1 Tax=Bradyrhizobium icense TaxID=1274631 RepID=A0A1B1UHM8_9BRAD|nr:right-handed parallel beta-helix repeat-containing protein [Bradyrhizobium icense]ANW02245.1 hypothetical protein LMTR13_20810 [Bradyrhizobium icense]